MRLIVKGGKKVLPALLATSVLLSGCGAATTDKLDEALVADGQPHFVRTVPYEPWQRSALTQMPENQELGFDLRSYDATALDLSGEAAALENVYFDTDTCWPDALPAGFDPAAILELGKNPGLGIRRLHQQGHTGKGINIAIVDQALLQDHEEYAGRVLWYESIHCSDDSAQMHGPAVTSIAAGKTCGVASQANIYYIESTFGTFHGENGIKEDLRPMAKSIERVLQLNETLPPEQKIKVISISKGITDAKGGAETLQAIEKAKQAGVFVITTSMQATYGVTLLGLGRNPMGNPDELTEYTPGIFWSSNYYESADLNENILLVPMDSRTYAGSGSTTGYEFGTAGGLSWSVPWLAGLYALCLEVDGSLTGEEFLALCTSTADSVTLQNQGQTYTLPGIVNPEKVLQQVKAGV